jgi:hypothetical protein
LVSVTWLKGAVDESHQFRQDGRITEFLRNRWHSRDAGFADTPLYAGALFLLSGTPWERGSEDLKIWLTWFNEKWDYNSLLPKTWVPRTHERTQLCSLKRIKDLQKSLDSRIR